MRYALKNIWLLALLLLIAGQIALSMPSIPVACEPAITFTAVPDYNTTDNLSGQVTCVDTTVYQVAVYIKVGGGWYNKPTWDEPLTTIQSDGSWTANITTNTQYDPTATQIAAFLLSDSYPPPILDGSAALPATLFDDAAAHAYAPRARRQISFSGYEWLVKQSDNPVGPGPNYFSDAEDAVWVDGNGRLHLTIQQKDGHWISTEVYTQMSLGYGRYLFQTDSPIDQLDANAVLGLFTWDDFTPSTYYREIDIEFARWGDAADPTNAQFVVQPWDQPDNLIRYTAVLTDTAATHSFDWQPDSITFFSVPGHTLNPAPGDAFETWVYTDTTYIPAPATVNVHLNLWLINGDPPSDGQPIEVIIEAFHLVADEVYLPVVLRP